MSDFVSVKTYDEPPFCRDQILRYAGCRKADEQTLSLMEKAIDLVRKQLSYRVCLREVPVRVCGDTVDFGLFSLSSASLAAHFRQANRAVLFAATTGLQMDRLIARFGRTAPAMGLMLQAVGAERIESLCDLFCREVCGGTARFSPGYGDLPLSAQTVLFSLLDPARRIGLTLTDSLLMSPSKSVTGFAALGQTCPEKSSRCTLCSDKGCPFRGVI